MKIWVDADACPNPIKEILYRAAERTGIALTLVANHELTIKPSQHIKFLRVAPGYDAADNEIVARLDKHDLVITSDIALAAAILDKGGDVLSPRGERFTHDTIKTRLTLRDLMESLRSSGIETDTQAPFSHRDRKAFADQLDQLLGLMQ